VYLSMHVSVNFIYTKYTLNIPCFEISIPIKLHVKRVRFIIFVV